MPKIRAPFRFFVVLTFLLTISAAAQARASRTWVSGVGDDVNPCSRTAPCKTFARGINGTVINFDNFVTAGETRKSVRLRNLSDDGLMQSRDSGQQ